MRTNHHIRPSAVLALRIAALALIGLAWTATPLEAQFDGRSTLEIPVATDVGDVQRDLRVALWMRPGQDGRPEFRLQYFSLKGDEAFRTEWGGSAEYAASGTIGHFALNVRDGDASTLHADLKWDLNFVDSGRTQTARITIYRTGDGRNLVFLFEDWLQQIRRGPSVSTGQALTQVWTFRKASRRQLLWDELPF